MMDNETIVRRFILPLVIVGSVVALLGLFITETIRAGLDTQEAPLTANGQVHELFHDGQGELWISDELADQVWRVDPATGDYTVYGNLIGASDGRIDSSGDLWWTDLWGQSLGRYTPGASKGRVWTLAVDAGPLGIAFDDQGMIWVSDAIASRLFSFDPESKEICAYPLPDGGTADYILYHDNALWMGDTTMGRIIRFNPKNGNFAYWQLADGAHPLDLAFDSSGNLWWADMLLIEIGRFRPANNRIRTYPIPELKGTKAKPIMVTVNDGKVWYTDQNGTVGRMDPKEANGRSTTAELRSKSRTPSCSDGGRGTAFTVSKRSGSMKWAEATYPVVENKKGWVIYELPDGAQPWGLTSSGNDIWFADQGDIINRQQMLGWMKQTGIVIPTHTPTATSRPPTATTGPPQKDEYLIALPVLMKSK